jgi:hypothetical protein
VIWLKINPSLPVSSVRVFCLPLNWSFLSDHWKNWSNWNPSNGPVFKSIKIVILTVNLKQKGLATQVNFNKIWKNVSLSKLRSKAIFKVPKKVWSTLTNSPKVISKEHKKISDEILTHQRSFKKIVSRFSIYLRINWEWHTLRCLNNSLIINWSWIKLNK